MRNSVRWTKTFHLDHKVAAPPLQTSMLFRGFWVGEAGNFHLGRPPPSFEYSMTHEPTWAGGGGGGEIQHLRAQGAGASVW